MPAPSIEKLAARLNFRLVFEVKSSSRRPRPATRYAILLRYLSLVYGAPSLLPTNAAPRRDAALSADVNLTAIMTCAIAVRHAHLANECRKT